MTPEQLKVLLLEALPWIILVVLVLALAVYGLVSLLR
jgi:hypothetical protein